MDIRESLDQLEANQVKEELASFLEDFSVPAFGSLPKREIELRVFELLRRLDILAQDASIYSLMTDLKVTRAKASQLIFDLEVRKHGNDTARLDEAIKAALIQTKFAKDGDYFVLEIENPLVLAHLRQRIKELGHISDTSFNTALVRAPVKAITDLMAELIANDQQAAIRQALIDAGAPEGMTFKGVLKGALGALGKKIAGQAGDAVAGAIVDRSADLLAPLLNGAIQQIQERWPDVFAAGGDPPQGN